MGNPVSLYGDDALDIFEIGYCPTDICPLGDADGHAGDNAIVIDDFGSIGADGFCKRRFPNFSIIHDDERVGAEHLFLEGFSEERRLVEAGKIVYDVAARRYFFL